MNFTTDPRKLASAVSWAARRVPSRPDVPILAGMLIEQRVNPSKITFTGFDHEVSTSATLVPDDDSEVDTRDGRLLFERCVVSGRLLAELVKGLPPKPITVDVDDDQMTIVCGPVRATLPLMPAEDYPSLPTSPEPIGVVHAQNFAKEVARVLPACDLAGERGLPALTGVHVAFTEKALTVTASNRYQLATNVVAWSPDDGVVLRSDFPILIPGEVLASVLKVCDYEGPLAIGVTDNAVSFSTGGRTIVSHLLDATKFPSHGGRIPPKAEYPTLINVEEVTDALKRASAVLDREPVRLAFERDLLTMYAGSGKGAVTAEIGCGHSVGPVEMVVNPTYFATAIGSVGATAELTMNGPLKPILVTALRDADYVHLMMPIRRDA